VTKEQSSVTLKECTSAFYQLVTSLEKQVLTDFFVLNILVRIDAMFSHKSLAVHLLFMASCFLGIMK